MSDVLLHGTPLIIFSGEMFSESSVSKMIAGVLSIVPFGFGGLLALEARAWFYRELRLFAGCVVLLAAANVFGLFMLAGLSVNLDRNVMGVAAAILLAVIVIENLLWPSSDLARSVIFVIYGAVFACTLVFVDELLGETNSAASMIQLGLPYVMGILIAYGAVGGLLFLGFGRVREQPIARHLFVAIGVSVAGYQAVEYLVRFLA